MSKEKKLSIQPTDENAVLSAASLCLRKIMMKPSSIYCLLSPFIIITFNSPASFCYSW